MKTRKSVIQIWANVGNKDFFHENLSKLFVRMCNECQMYTFNCTLNLSYNVKMFIAKMMFFKFSQFYQILIINSFWWKNASLYLLPNSQKSPQSSVSIKLPSSYPIARTRNFTNFKKKSFYGDKYFKSSKYSTSPLLFWAINFRPMVFCKRQNWAFGVLWNLIVKIDYLWKVFAFLLESWNNNRRSVIHVIFHKSGPKVKDVQIAAKAERGNFYFGENLRDLWTKKAKRSQIHYVFCTNVLFL